MEKDTGKRYQSAEEVHSELTKIEKGIPTTERVIPKIKAKTEKIGAIKWKKYIVYGSAAIFLILLIIAGVSLFTGRRKAIDSIAVLPMDNLSGNPEQEYFADGMTEALISELAKIKALGRVISRQSVMRYKGSDKPLPEIARELNVGAVVEGSVLLIGKQVRITAQLLEAATDRHLWTESYERDLSDVLALQKEIARTIAQEIKIAVTPEEEAHLKTAPPVNPEAFQLYMRGRYFWNKRIEGDLKKSVKYFEQAIEKDSDYAHAYAGLADAYIVLPDYSSFPPGEAYQKAEAAAKKALEIDDTLAEAYTSLAFLKANYYWDWEIADREYKRAIELKPNYATAHHWYALFLISMARVDEAIKEIRRAHELDPFSLVINRNIGAVLYRARNYDQAIEALKRTLEMDPNFIYAHGYLGLAYLKKSMYEEALAEIQKERGLSRTWNPRVEAWIAVVYVNAGNRSKAQEVLDGLIKRSELAYVSPYCIALVYFALGDDDQGFKWLAKASEERDQVLRYLKIDPLLDTVHSDPRFKAMLEKVGLD